MRRAGIKNHPGSGTDGWCCLILLVLCLAWIPASQGGDNQAARLERLRQRIQTLQQTLNGQRGQQRQLRHQLQMVEQALGRLGRALKETERSQRQQAGKLQRLRVLHRRRQQALSRQRSLLGQQILAAYAMGRQSYLKIILNQQDPAVIGRTLVYYDYFNRARAVRIRHINARLREIRILEQTINREAERLAVLSKQQRHQLASRKQFRQRRHQVLAKLGAEIHGREQRLQKFLQDEQRLSKLLGQLQQALADISPEAGRSGAFASQKGRLSWPTRGRIRARFGQLRRTSSRLRWQGVLIEAPEGAEVRSIHSGRVAFADWLRGFGLLLIIDHGNGYMSLYAHNQSLYRSVGEWVPQGAVIATVGNSGGRSSPALYFEIRHNGRPADPLKWVRAGK